MEKEIILFSNYDYYDHENFMNLEEESGEPYTEEMFYDDQKYAIDELQNAISQLSNRSCIAIGKLGLWKGKCSAYNDTIKMNNLLNILGEDIQNFKVFIENGELKATGSHHDGTNHYFVRRWRNKVTESQKNKLKNYIYNLDDSVDFDFDLIDKYTVKIGRDVYKKIFN